jgi:HD-GYP domain-containing protein (c-di-GMP phosphodiesterase class II)
MINTGRKWQWVRRGGSPEIIPRSTAPATPDSGLSPSPEILMGVILALALAVEQRDDITAGHCERLAITSLALAMSMGLDERGGGFIPRRFPARHR